MRTVEFAQPDGLDLPTSSRHQARSLHFNDQSIFSYDSPNKHWWGYA